MVLIKNLCCSFAFLSLIIFNACDEGLNPKLQAEIQKLPPATETGANTCGCLLNGKAWISDLPNPDTLRRVYSIGQFTQWLGIPFPSGDTLTITSRQWPTPRVTDVKHNVMEKAGWAYLETLDANYHSGYSPKSLITITFSKYDVENLIMSGTFYMKLYPPDSLINRQPVLEFTNCRFDFQFKNF